MKGRFAAEGVAGLVHRLRGRPSPRRLASEIHARAVALLQGRYTGLNDCHLTEKLREVEALPLSRSTVRRLRRGAMTTRTPRSQILIAGGIAWQARQPGVRLRIA